MQVLAQFWCIMGSGASWDLWRGPVSVLRSAPHQPNCSRHFGFSEDVHMVAEWCHGNGSISKGGTLHSA